MVSVEVITPYLMVQQLNVIQLHLGDHVVLQKQQDGVEYLMTIAHVMVVQTIELAALEEATAVVEALEEVLQVTNVKYSGMVQVVHSFCTAPFGCSHFAM